MVLCNMASRLHARPLHAGCHCSHRLLPDIEMKRASICSMWLGYRFRVFPTAALTRFEATFTCVGYLHKLPEDRGLVLRGVETFPPTLKGPNHDIHRGKTFLICAQGMTFACVRRSCGARRALVLCPRGPLPWCLAICAGHAAARRRVLRPARRAPASRQHAPHASRAAVCAAFLCSARIARRAALRFRPAEPQRAAQRHARCGGALVATGRLGDAAWQSDQDRAVRQEARGRVGHADGGRAKCSPEARLCWSACGTAGADRQPCCERLADLRGPESFHRDAAAGTAAVRPSSISCTASSLACCRACAAKHPAVRSTLLCFHVL